MIINKARNRLVLIVAIASIILLALVAYISEPVQASGIPAFFTLTQPADFQMVLRSGYSRTVGQLNPGVLLVMSATKPNEAAVYICDGAFLPDNLGMTVHLPNGAVGDPYTGTKPYHCP